MISCQRKQEVVLGWLDRDRHTAWTENHTMQLEVSEDRGMSLNSNKGNSFLVNKEKRKQKLKKQDGLQPS